MNWKYYQPKFEFSREIPSAWWGHVWFAYDLVRNIKPKRIVELGTHNGVSFFSLCQAVKDGGLNSEIIAIDSWEGDRHAGEAGSITYSGKVFEEVKNVVNNSYSELNYRLERKYFDEAINKFDNNSIDLLHIDGLHTYEAVNHDFNNWIKKVSSDGIVLLHDTNEKKDDFGVYRLWEELERKYETMEFLHSHGMGIIFNNGRLKKELEVALKNSWQNYYMILDEKKILECLMAKKQEELESQLMRIDEIVKQKTREIEQMSSSKFWRLRERYMKLKGLTPEYILRMLKKAWTVLRKEGPVVFIKKLFRYLVYDRSHLKTGENPNDYHSWIKRSEKFDKENIKKEIQEFKYLPKISIIVPVFNVEAKWLDKCIESVVAQYYENWELCLHDDASTRKETVECLKKWEKRGDLRMKISFGKENQHISEASNEALKNATGEFVALLDNDDELSLDALFEVVKCLNDNPNADFIYSDEDKLSPEGERRSPFFKPDWSPDFILSTNYTCHLGVYRKKIIDEIGGLRKGYEGSQDYDLVLRVIEKTKPENIFHISKILYHWREIPGSTSMEISAKDYTQTASRKALSDYLQRNEIEGEVLDGRNPGRFRIKRKINGNPKISIIIPFRDQAEALRVCLRSIFEKTNYKNYEIILVDNQSREEKTHKYLEEVERKSNVKILKYEKPFNFSAINNFAVTKCQSDYILFLNNDMEVISDEWLESMLEHAQRKEVGAVGAKLVYPNNTIQHAGVIMGLGVASHAFKDFPVESEGYFCQLDVIKNYSAVTAACLLTRRKVFEEVGGFDEVNLSIAYNDVDFCLKMINRGYNVVYTPYAILYHYESLSRGSDNEEDLKQKNPEKYKRVILEREYMREKWRKYIDNDPYYNPNLTRRGGNYGISVD